MSAVNPYSLERSRHRSLKLVISVLAASIAMAGCKKGPEAPKEPSDPTDYFYREKGVEGIVYPGIRFHERQPGRLFETTLRPTGMTGTFPSPYLVRITRHDQPYEEKIHDVVYAAFQLADNSPYPIAQGGRPAADVRTDEVRLEIGGWSQSSGKHPQWLAQIYKEGRLENHGHDVFVTGKGDQHHYFTAIDSRDFDGRPVVVECWVIGGCHANLTIPQEMAGLRPMQHGRLPGHSIGARLRISFAAEHIQLWPEIRRKAICFAAFSIPKLDTSKIVSGNLLRCTDVRDAIKRTIKKSEIPECSVSSCN